MNLLPPTARATASAAPDGASHLIGSGRRSLLTPSRETRLFGVSQVVESLHSYLEP
jgi:hypothetical protein